MKKEKFIGICKVGEKGQIVIPKEARDMFDIKSGDSVIVLCERKRGFTKVLQGIYLMLSAKFYII